MANILSKIQIIGDRVSHRDGLFNLPNDFSDLSFFEIDNNRLLSLNFYKKWQRSLPKDGAIAAACLEELSLAGKITAEPGRLGIYGAFVNGPLLYSQHENLINSDVQQSFHQLKKNWPPKQHFRQNGALKLAHLSFILKNQGPMFCFTHPLFAVWDALQVAEIDLYNKRIDQAVVVSAFSLEDPVHIFFYKQQGEKKFYESGVALLLDGNDELRNYTDDRNQPTYFSYGTCSPIINHSTLTEGNPT